MRALFLLIVLANLAFFAWASFVSRGDTQSDPRPYARQIAPEKLRIVPADTPASAPAPAAGTAPAPPLACLEWGGILPTDVARANEALAPLALGSRLTRRLVADDSAGWWVFMPPRPSRQDAQKKAAELRALGVEEYFVVQDEGPLRYAISLGVFKTEAAAENRLAALRERGVKTAQIGRRDNPTQRLFLQIRPVEGPLAAKLRTMAQSFPGSEVHECPAVTGEAPASSG